MLRDNGIGEPIDRKFTILAASLEHGRLHDENDSVLFLAKDRAFVAVLPAYRDECAALGAGGRQLAGIDRLIERVNAYQAANPDVVKIPDVDDGPVGDAIVAANRRP